MSVFTVIILKFSFLFPFRRAKWMQGGAIILVAGSFEAATLLPPAAQALNRSLGPGLELWDRMGPNGAQIFPVQDRDTFELSGLRPGGAGAIRIGQWEPALPRYDHDMISGRVTPNLPPPSTDDHATGVASILVGTTFNGIKGINPQAVLYSENGDYYSGINTFLGTYNVEVLNMSAGFCVQPMPGAPCSMPIFPPLTGNSAQSLFADMIINSRALNPMQSDVVWVNAAGNEGARGASTLLTPADAYNLISVGATGADQSKARSEVYTRVADYSSHGPTTDAGGRHKPDIVAPGSLIDMAGGSTNMALQHGIGTSGTSFAAPHVAGMAALLIERAAEQPNTISDQLAIKATLMNSASKHLSYIDSSNMDKYWVDSDAAKLDALGASTPVDDVMGIGQLNGVAAVRQLQPQNRRDVALVHPAGQPTGNLPPGTVHFYDVFLGGELLQPGSLVTSTLTWNRPVTHSGGSFDNDVNYAGTILPKVDLQLVKLGVPGVMADMIVDQSTSMTDNVEHIYFNVTEKGSYQLQVVSTEPVGGLTVNDYALAWSSGTSEGLAFSVDGGYFNPNRNDPNPAEGLMAPFGNNPYPNDVNALGPAGPGFFATDSEIFVSSENGTNMQRISGALGTRSRVGPHNGPPAGMAVLDPGEDANNNNRLDPSEDKNGNGKLDRQRGVLGLIPNDNISGLSWGTDGTNGLPSVLLFSVDPQTEGKVGTDVNYQAKVSPVGGPPVKPYADNPGGGDPGNEAAGDIYKSQKYNPFGDYDIDIIEPAPPGSNKLVIDEQQLGLQAPKSHGNLLKPTSESGAETRCKFCEEDDLDALELDSVLSNPRRAVDPDGDGLHNQPIFFALDRWSPSLVKYGGPDVESADDIFVSRPPDLSNNFDLMPGTVFPKFNIFADGVTHMGLSTVDGLDALVLSDVFRIGILDPGYDEALFSLDPDSASTCGSVKSPANVYYTKFNGTCTLFASYTSLGLLPNDNLDALDIKKTPGPLPFLGAGVAFRFSRKLRRRLRVYRMA